MSHPTTSPDDIDLAKMAVADALDDLLVAMVALGAVEDVDVPTFAIDKALGTDGRYQAAREAFRDVHEELRGPLGEDHRDLFFRIEDAAHALSTRTADVGFQLGISVGRTRS